MSTFLYLTFGDRTVMLAKPATYQDLKHEIRKQFPMLASVFSLVVLFKPHLENGSMLNNWVEVDLSAYSAVHDGAEVFINVAEPISKRYVFPFPDGRNSNVGPMNQVPHTDGMGNRINPSMGGVPLADAQQVSTKESSSSRKPKAKYDGPGSDTPRKFERLDGDACASGWAGASEQFRRSAGLIPDLKDCKEAVGLEVGQSNCYPDEEDGCADDDWGHFQEEEEPNPGPTERGWYTGAENITRRDDQTGEDCRANHATTLPAGGAFNYDNGQNGNDNFNNAGKSISGDNANNIRSPSPYHGQTSRYLSPPPTAGSTPKDYKPSSHRSKGWNANAPSMCGVSPPLKNGWGSDDGVQKGVKSSFYGRPPRTYIKKSPHGSRGGSPIRASNNGGWGWGVDACKTKDNADQESTHTAFAYGPYNNVPVSPAAPYGGGYANQVSQDSHHYTHDYGASDWSPHRRPYSGYRWPQQRQARADSQSSRLFYHDPLHSSFTPADPGRVITGSPVAKFRRSHLRHWSMGDRKRQTWANANNYQEQTQEGDRQYLSDFNQNGSNVGHDDDDLAYGEVGNYQGENEDEYEYERDNAEDFWYAAPTNATQTAGRGRGAIFKRSRQAVRGKKTTTDKARQNKHDGWKVSTQGWGDGLGWDHKKAK
ncbi:hypothetical protein VM1G_10284 [Cytospora mali]|uniref:Uncharacterized protein n=1 Tax=Cytospora mali TaxID=578113 RepID=A0A194VI92_CYTMA|nr:hypothetical protein VM1G_10284 [Valsa mali]